MKKRRKIINLLLIVLLVMSLAMLAACNNTTPQVEEDDPAATVELTEGLLITNSDLKVTTGTTYPLKPSNWTGAAFSTTAYPNDVIAGVIDVSSSTYDANKSKWYNLANPGKNGAPDDDAELMIYMPAADTDIDGVDEAKAEIEYGPTAYGYTSTSFTISPGYYYKLLVDVKTEDIAGGANAGARIYVASSAYTEFKSINTNGEWETYEIYIEGPKDSSKTLTINFSLGYYSGTHTSEYLTTGYAFFDNIELAKIAATDSKTAQAQYDEVTDAMDDQINKITYTVPNGEFDFGSVASSSSSSAPSLWTLSTGGSTTDYSAPTAYRYNGIVNTEESAFTTSKSKLGTTIYTVEGSAVVARSSVSDLTNPGVSTGVAGTNVYMLSQIYMTAQYLYSTTPIVIEKGKYYVLTVPVYTTGIFGEGVTITLSGNGEKISFTGISKSVYDDEEAQTGVAGTTSGWSTYTFAIKGNQYRDLSYTMQLWLGTGDTSDNTEKSVTRYTGAAEDYTTTTKKTTQTTYESDGTFTKGWAFFDSIKLAETSEANYNSYGAVPVITFGSEDTEIDGEANQSMRLNLSQTNYFTTFDGNFGTNFNDANISYDDNTLGTPSGWVTSFDADSNNAKIDGVTIDSLTRAGTVDTSDDEYFTTLGLANPGVPYNIGTTNVLMLRNTANQLYRIDSANFDIIRNTSYRISVWVKTADIKATSGAYIYLLDENDATLKASALINTADYEDEFTNDWVEYSFIVRGYSDKDITASLRLAIGSGDKWASTTLANGTAFFANVNCCAITETEYTSLSAVTSYTTSASYSTTESGLLIYNRAFDLIDLDETEGMVDGELSTALGTPLNWTASSTKNTDVKSGIAKFNTGNGTDFIIDPASQLDNLGYSSAVENEVAKLGGANWSIYDNWPTDSASAIDNLNGGPNALVIDGTSGADSYAYGYASDSISLSKVTNYSISVWVRTVGTVTYSLYLIGENGSTTEFDQTNYIQVTTSDGVWTKHTFYVEVGLVSTSVKLGMWLGTNAEVTDEVKSKGIVIFDSITYSSTVTSEEFDALSVDTNNRKMSFLSDGFDAAGNEIGAKSSLTSPDGWTGEAVTGGTATKSAKGVIYAKDFGSFIDLDSVFGISYPDGYATMEEGAEKDAITADVEASKIPISELNPMSNGGSRFLIINNKEDNGYFYTSTAYTLSAETFFRISVWVKTYNVTEDKGAYVELAVTDNDKEFININTSTWTEYVFFVKTADTDISNVAMKIGLGKNAETEEDTNSLLTGYAMFDNVTFGILTEAEYEAIDTESELFTSGRAYVIEAPESSANVDDDEDPNEEEPTWSPDLTYLWWMIPTIIMALALIMVLVAVIVKKFYKPRKQKALEASYSKEAKTSDSLEVKKDEYDKFKE
ncbi:MAG: hypothetical protein PHE93_02980 [Clostridia bacterium]|nr:hypothetical protein [Clostridia bacterium]